MRIDIPLCGFKYCKYSLDCNCTATDLQRERCDYLRYKQAEDEGRLVELPCKIGDTVYVAFPECIEEQQADYFEIFSKGEVVLNTTITTIQRPWPSATRREHMDINQFGKTVFLTRKQAEQSKEGQNGQ